MRVGKQTDGMSSLDKDEVDRADKERVMDKYYCWLQMRQHEEHGRKWEEYDQDRTYFEMDQPASQAAKSPRGEILFVPASGKFLGATAQSSHGLRQPRLSEQPLERAPNMAHSPGAMPMQEETHDQRCEGPKGVLYTGNQQSVGLIPRGSAPNVWSVMTQRAKSMIRVSMGDTTYPLERLSQDTRPHDPGGVTKPMEEQFNSPAGRVSVRNEPSLGSQGPSEFTSDLISDMHMDHGVHNQGEAPSMTAWGLPRSNVH